MGALSPYVPNRIVEDVKLSGFACWCHPFEPYLCPVCQQEMELLINFSGKRLFDQNIHLEYASVSVLICPQHRDQMDPYTGQW
jgi:hypothetical protein